jgi:pseudaminic acid biosynthesis-associated methylase
VSGFKTEQEAFWAGDFGDAYITRNRGEGWVAANVALFARILKSAAEVRSVLELGANIGLNLQALRLLLPEAQLAAVEINDKAIAQLRKLPGVKVQQASILELVPDIKHDLVFTKGVLIHINPGELLRVYDLMYRSSARYLCVAEYYNPTPIAIPYRGHAERLFKRDFAGELLERFPDLQLVDYGFVYRRDPTFPQDDLTWFLLEKGARAAAGALPKLNSDNA